MASEQENPWMDEARQAAEECWETAGVVSTEQDPELLEAVARQIAHWIQTAAQHARNEEFYRDLLDQTAQHLGPEVYVSDDGSVQQDPVRLKVPELVRNAAGELYAKVGVIEAVDRVLHQHNVYDASRAKAVERVLESLAEFRRLAEQFCCDLNEAHDEILRQQDCSPAEFSQYDWPGWTPQANSIRWAEKLLQKKLAKTDQWTLFPDTQPPSRTTSCGSCPAPPTKTDEDPDE